MKLAQLEHALASARAAATEAGKNLLPYFGNVESETKSNTGERATDIVTKLDRDTETFLADKLAKYDSSFGFRGEEFGTQSKADVTWLVDPIDGTNHFVRGIPFCTTMIALIENNDVLLAVIHDFVRGDTYTAIKGQGAFCNDKKIVVSDRTVDTALISFETRMEGPDNIQTYLKLRQKKIALISTINCGFEFSLIASGRLEGRIAKQPYGFDWDYAPGSLLVQEAGGVATNIGKNSYDYREHDYIIANPQVHEVLTTGKNAIFPILNL